jgi:YfiR/HmsC-like
VVKVRRLTVIARASVRLAGFVTLAVAAGGASHLAAQEPVRENTLKAAIVAKLHRAAALPVLTMGDDDRFLDEGGIVRLRVVDGHPRFDVDEAAARRVGLRISSKLLELAATVRRGPS